MADSLFEDSQFYAHNKMDQPDKMRILCSRAQDALKMARLQGKRGSGQKTPSGDEEGQSVNENGLTPGGQPETD